jgi:hypothetical protein
MRESRPYGFVRGALSNERPYRVADFRLWPFATLRTVPAISEVEDRPDVTAHGRNRRC